MTSTDKPAPLSGLLSLSGKRAVITGGGRGIGKAVARYLAEDGAAVVVTARSTDQIEQVARFIRELLGDGKGRVGIEDGMSNYLPEGNLTHYEYGRLVEELPGVGHKTASVLMCQAFGLPAFPVDTHIHRLAARWGLSNGKSVVKTEQDLKSLFPADTWIRRHLQIIYFGREHCPARGHDLSRCEICSWAATKKRIVEESRRR